MADASAPSPTPNNVELPSADQEPTANGTAAMDVEMKEEPIADVKATQFILFLGIYYTNSI